MTQGSRRRPRLQSKARGSGPPGRRRTTLSTLLIALLLASCGKMGPPRLPELAVPRPPEPVQVRNVEAGLEVSFRRPSEYLDGATLGDLGNFEVSRLCDNLPEYVAVANIPVVDREKFQKQRRISLVDFDPEPGRTCSYRVIAVTLDGYRSSPAESPPVLRQWPLAATDTPPDS